MTTDTGRRVVVRASDRPGDIAELVSPENAEAARERLQRATQAALGDQAASFGPALPSSQPGAAKPADAPPARRQLPIGSILIALCSILLAIGLVLLSQIGRGATGQASGLPLAQAETATLAPTAEQPTATPVMLALYWSPDGDNAGFIANTQPYTPTARYGSDWLQVKTPSGAKLWLSMSAAQLDQTPAFEALPDLEPPPTPTQAPRPVATEPPPAPQPCTLAGAVAIVADTTGYYVSCISVADAQANRPRAQVVASSPADAQTWIAKKLNSGAISP